MDLLLSTCIYDLLYVLNKFSNAKDHRPLCKYGKCSVRLHFVGGMYTGAAKVCDIATPMIANVMLRTLQESTGLRRRLCSLASS